MYKFCILLAIAFISFVTADTFTNPIKPDNGADPSLLYTAEDGGWYYLVNTGNNGKMEMMRGRTLNDLKKSERKVILDTAWPWVQVSDLWAPEIHQINGTYVYREIPLHRFRMETLTKCQVVSVLHGARKITDRHQSISSLGRESQDVVAVGRL